MEATLTLAPFQIAPILERNLREKWPNVKWHVRWNNDDGWCAVDWTDGPPLEPVRAFVRKFEGVDQNGKPTGALIVGNKMARSEVANVYCNRTYSRSFLEYVIGRCEEKTGHTSTLTIDIVEDHAVISARGDQVVNGEYFADIVIDEARKTDATSWKTPPAFLTAEQVAEKIAALIGPRWPKDKFTIDYMDDKVLVRWTNGPTVMEVRKTTGYFPTIATEFKRHYTRQYLERIRGEICREYGVSTSALGIIDGGNTAAFVSTVPVKVGGQPLIDLALHKAYTTSVEHHTPPPAPPKKKQTRGEKMYDYLLGLAEGMTTDILYKERPMTQNPTRKRMNEFSSRLQDAQFMRHVQEALAAIAFAYRDGNVPPVLNGINSKRAVEILLRLREYPTSEYSADLRKSLTVGGISASNFDNARTTLLNLANPPQETPEQKLAKLEAEVLLKDIPGFWPTPESLIKKMVDFVICHFDRKDWSDLRFLEPSAGRGDIADWIRDMGAKVSCVEISPTLREILVAKGHVPLAATDFMGMTPSDLPARQYDAIVMNPPFENGQDMEHIQHAYKFLKKGGILVAIASVSAVQGHNSKSSRFVTWLNQAHGKFYHNDPDAFKSAPKQTGVRTVTIVIPKRTG